VVADFLKHRFNQGREDRLCFYRGSGGNEVDVLVPMGEGFFDLFLLKIPAAFF
jgi:hypothetical protein